MYRHTYIIFANMFLTAPFWNREIKIPIISVSQLACPRSVTLHCHSNELTSNNSVYYAA